MKLCYLLFVLIIFSSCAKDKTTEIIEPSISICDSIPSSFSTDVYPVFDTYCISCHSAGSPSGGYSLENYAQISQNITICLQTMNSEPGVVAMPYQGSPLPDSLIRKIECWVEDGTQNN